MSFKDFDEMFNDLWTYLGTKDTKYRQKYRKLMHKVREMQRRHVTPDVYTQDKIYKIYQKEVGRTDAQKVLDILPDNRTEKEKLKDDKSRLPKGRLFRYNR